MRGAGQLLRFPFDLFYPLQAVQIIKKNKVKIYFYK